MFLVLGVVLCWGGFSGVTVSEGMVAEVLYGWWGFSKASKMGYVHLHWERDYFHHKSFQKDRPGDRITNQQHNPEVVNAEITDNM
jgi:hypothetical protein